MKIEERWTELFGKPMPAEVSTRILKIQKALGIEDDDAIWQILLALEFYQNLYQVWPESTRKEVEAVTIKLRESSRQVIAAAAAEVQKTEASAKASLNQALSQMMSAAVRQALDQIVKSTHAQALRIEARKWALIGMVTAAVLVSVLAGGAGWYGYRAGREGGYVSGVAEGGDIRHFIRCDKPGWKIVTKEEGVRLCIPYGDKDGYVWGWTIP
ncbi:MAG: hypothetical protein M1313_08505 [Nitrospirae bacterium]|nr:hypothetical protein [Nitrospirota bacterium]